MGVRQLRGQVESRLDSGWGVFGDDQQEGFDFNNFPAFSMCVAAQFEDRRIDEEERGEQPLRAAT